ncbi:MAG: protein translocase subunit SecD [Acidobacteria bacterium]|nr:protein translocase subunit SecD [Acidobacteriota bacterium]
MSPLRWKATVILVTVLVCLVGLVCFRKMPDAKTRFYLPRSLDDLRTNVSERINLGLDLRGGMHLILQVQVDEAINSETDQVVERLRTLLREQAIGFQSIRKADPTHVQVAGIPNDQLDAARRFLQESYGGSTVAPAYTIGSLAGEESGLVLEMTPTLQAQLRQEALRNAIETIRQRVDALGVSEPAIAEHGRGEWEILVQLPGVDDPARVKSILQSTALLEIKLVEDGPYGSESEALVKTGGILPPDSMLLQELPHAHEDRAAGPQWYIVSRTSIVTGRDLRSARAEANPESPGTYQVSFSLSRDGAARFGPFTERNVGRPLGVVLDNRIQSVAVIQSRIEDAGRITGTFTLQEAADLALVLRSGSLPASIRYLEERTVGPSLGADSIRAGLTASGVGLLAVSLFMLFYYRLSGVNALLALLLNLLLLLAALAYVGATLTLPGIAGVALTIGMAVDANVLVFERIREELRLGKTVVAGVETGFDRAFVTIFDTNLTTIIAAIFLFMFGTGPIKGFAVTLTFGLLANIFAAVYVSRAIFEFVLSRQARPTTLSI